MLSLHFSKEFFLQRISPVVGEFVSAERTPARVGTNRLAVYAWIVVAWNLVVIMWGAFVRATGSGAGCGSHWPLCNGEVLPRAPQVGTLIELTHRATSGIALLMLVALVVWARWRFPPKHLVRRAAYASAVFMILEALIGAGLVLFELVADNDSIARAIYLSVHLVNTFLLVGALTLTAWWATGESKKVEVKKQKRLAWMFAACLVGTLVLGVSGAIAALGDTLFPARSLAHGFAQDFAPAAHFLVRLRIFHPAIAIAVGAGLIAAATVAARVRPQTETKRLASLLTGLVLSQLALGALNVWLLAPIPVQLIHLFLADLLWMALIVLAASSLGERSAQTYEAVRA
ncbi:MAG: COX15/CtaA family protein [Pyrinomonadaceae bacterium]|nr:COX15/CtaA family protein [Pyrinomonadaceae bacterium]